MIIPRRDALLTLVGLGALALTGCADEDDVCPGDDSGQPCGDTRPSWSLIDHQPATPRFLQRYGLAQFRGARVALSVVAANCDYCSTQVGKLEEMKRDLLAAGIDDVEIIALNVDYARDDVKKLASACSYTVFQDERDVGAVAEMGGRDFDIFLFGRDGVLQRVLRLGGKTNYYIYTQQGYANIRQAVLSVT